MGSGVTTWLLRAGLAIFIAGGLVSARLDGTALVDLPFGPGATGGPVIGDAVMLATDTQPVPAHPRSAIPLPDPLVIATEGDFPPFNFVDETGAVRGLEVDFVYAMCAELGVACRIEVRAWGELLPGLRAGHYHAVAASLRIVTPPPPGIAFTRPYFATAAAFATRRGDPQGRSDGPVAVEANTRMAAWIAAQPDAPPVRLHDDPVAAYRALAEGEARAVLDDAVRLSRWLADPSSACCALAGGTVTDPHLLGEGVGFAVRAGDTSLAEALDGAIRAMTAGGAIAELTERYLPVALN